MIDQAAELRNLVLRASRRSDGERQRAPRLVVLMGGKGGVGVTTLAVNLSIALSAQRYRIVLIDADLYRADIALMCNLQERHNLGDVLSGKASLADVLQPGPGGIQIVPGIWAPERQTPLDGRHGQRLLNEIRSLGTVADIVVLDAGSAAAELVHYVRPAMHDAVLVTTPDAVAIMDCYATIKTVLCNNRRHDGTVRPSATAASRHDSVPEPDETLPTVLGLITNQVKNTGQANDVYARIAQSTQRFLGIEIHEVGAVPRDPLLREAAGGQPLILADPAAPAARAMHALAASLNVQWNLQTDSPRIATA